MKQLKEKGITLIVLVITIIILLILAGVTISQIGGSNGLFSRIRQAVDQYKNASLEEQESILEFEKYMTDFTITGGDEEVKIKIIGVETTAGTDKITVKVTIEGTATRVEYNKSKDEKWYTNEGKENSTEYTFENVEPGSYLIKVRAYDEEGNYQEATSGIVTVMPITTAEAEDVLEGKTYITGESKLKTGKMTKNGTIKETLSSGEVYTIPKGYHDGTGKIIAEGLANQTQGNAGEGDILEGKIAWVNGEQVTGTMVNKGKVTQTLNAGQSYTIPAGYHNGQGTVAAKSLADQTPGTATEGHILSGDKAWVNGKQLTGTMVNKGKVTQTLNAGQSYTIPAGYHNGQGTVAAKSLADQTPGTATEGHILSGETAWVDGAKVIGDMPNHAGNNIEVTKDETPIPEGYYDGTGKIITSSLESNKITKTTSRPWSSAKTRVEGSVQLDFSEFKGNDSITEDSFIVGFTWFAGCSSYAGNSGEARIGKKEYNSETGILTVWYSPYFGGDPNNNATGNIAFTLFATLIY